MSSAGKPLMFGVSGFPSCPSSVPIRCHSLCNPFLQTLLSLSRRFRSTLRNLVSAKGPIDSPR